MPTRHMDTCSHSFAGPDTRPHPRTTEGLIPCPSPVRLWVDDVRPAPPGWYWVTTSEGAIRLLKIARRAEIEILECSLNHDLGIPGGDADGDTASSPDSSDGPDTTRPVVMWMCEHDYFPTTVRVHSANPVDRQWLQGMLHRYAPTGCLQL